MQGTDNLSDNNNIDNSDIINSINEDIKHNGFRKWLLYLRFYIKNRFCMDEEDLQDTREKIVYNYKKEEGYRNDTPLD